MDYTFVASIAVAGLTIFLPAFMMWFRFYKEKTIRDSELRESPYLNKKFEELEKDAEKDLAQIHENINSIVLANKTEDKENNQAAQKIKEIIIKLEHETNTIKDNMKEMKAELQRIKERDEKIIIELQRISNLTNNL